MAPTTTPASPADTAPAASPAASALAASPAASAVAKAATTATTAVASAAAKTATKPPSGFGPHFPYDDFDGTTFPGFNHTGSDFKYNPSNYKYNPKDYKFDDDSWNGFGYDWKRRWMERASHALTIVAVLIIAAWVLQFITYRKYDVMEWIRRRRMAAKYKRVKKHEGLATADEGPDTMSGGESGGEEDIGLLEVVASSFSADESVPCTVDLGDGKPAKTCEAYVGTLEKVSELPFMLSEACRRSGDPELGAFSLVDLYLKDRIKLEYVSGAGNGETKRVGKYGETTPSMLLKAKSFKVTVLQPTTR